MRLKKLIAALLCIIICFVLSACGDTKNTDSDKEKVNNESKNETVESEESTPLLYKVTDDDGDVIWLFGSIHVGDDYFYPLPDYVLDALNNAESLAVEFDIVAFQDDTSAQMNALKCLILTDGSTVDDLIDEEIYEEAKELLDDCGYYSSYLDYYMPSLWSSFIDSAAYEKIGVDTELGVDQHLINYAYDNDIPVLGIESAEIQYAMLADFSIELQEMLLKNSITSYKYSAISKYQLKKQMKAWAKGDEEELISQLSMSVPKYVDDEQKALYEEYYEKLITERNLSMTDWAEDALDSGDEIFICVGAAHVVGEDAMLDLLEERGYTVELVK